MPAPKSEVIHDVLRDEAKREKLQSLLEKDTHPDIQQVLEILGRFHPRMLLTELGVAVKILMRNWETFDPETQRIFEITQMKNEKLWQ